MQRPHLHFHLGSFFPHHLTRAIKQLYGSVAILGFAVSAVTVFEPIYLYTLGYSLHAIAGYYLTVYALYVFLLPIGARFAARFGYSRSILLGSSLFIPYYLALFGLAHTPWLFYAAPVLFMLQKIFYWPAFHADFASYSSSGEVGREIGEASLVNTIVSILGPIAGGAVIAGFGFPTLFVVVALLVLLSNIPLLGSRMAATRESFSYAGAWRQVFDAAHWRFFIAYAGYGEETVYMIFWPIFVFSAVAGALRVGVIMTAAGLLTSLVLLYIGKLADARSRPSMVHAASVATAVTSIMRGAVFSAVTFVFGETLYRVSRGGLDLPLITELYSRAKRRGALRTVTAFEMSLAVGKAILLAVLFGFTAVFAEPWFAIFLLGALMALLFLFLPRSADGEN